jgi:hypothetical protein
MKLFAFTALTLTASIAFAQQGELPKNEVEITVRGDYRHIVSNGIPDHAYGRFPNRGNPHYIRAQNYEFRVPLKPVAANRATQSRGALFGVALNGVVFDPGTAEFWNGDRRWNYEALSGKINLGMDANNAHVQPDGSYHYHGLPTGLIKNRTREKTMTLIGYAADGFPIYATFGHAVADDAKSDLKRMRSSYRLKKGTRPGGQEGPGGAYDGTFTADYEYVAGSGDLDEYNGRFGVTSEYPQGIYHYFVTEEFPNIPRFFKGTPDNSFFRRGPGGPRGGPGGGPGGGRPPFGPPPPGFPPPF